MYQAAGQKDSVVFYAKEALQKAQAGEFTSDILNASQFLSKVFEDKGQEVEAFHYYKIATAAKDSLFSEEKVKHMLTLDFDEKMKQQEMVASTNSYQDKVKIYILLGGLAVLVLIAIVLIRSNMQKQKANALLQKQKKEIDAQKAKAEQALKELKTAQKQLIQSEKMASLGELTAGIAHEIQNPLNFVNNFSEVNLELARELKEEINKTGLLEEQKETIETIANDIVQNQEKINYHGKRADAIVKGMLQHSRASMGNKELTDINALVDEYLRLSYHGLRAKDKSFNATMETDFDKTLPKINIIPQDVGRVILNIFNNAFYSVTEKKKAATLKGENYEPTVWVTTKSISSPSGAGGLEICVRDNGLGIPQKVLEKIYQPFFSTKPTGQGTGLGLSISYDIITKVHGGQIKVETQEGEYAEFIINLPVK